MRSLIWRWLLNAGALLVTAWLLGGVEVRGVGAGLVAALILGIVNASVRPVLLFLTLPLNLLTLGLFTLVVNALMLQLVDLVVPGFRVASFLVAAVAAVVLGALSAGLNLLLGEPPR